MGEENILSILELAKDSGVGFMNMHGMWNVALSRARAATVIVVSHKAIIAPLNETPGKEPALQFYLTMIA